MASEYEARDLGTDADGFQRIALATTFQTGAQEDFPLRILVPKRPAEKVLWVLPVNPGLDRPWRDGLIEVQKLGAHERHALLCVAPAFATWPWYADRPGTPAIRQESFLLKALLPFLEERFAVAKATRPLLLGFSKSGCGAFSLLLRNPACFARAAAFDSPFMQDVPNRYKMQDVFVSREHLAEYFVPRLVRERADSLRTAPRLAILGQGTFTDEMRQLHALLEELAIPHHYSQEVERAHAWDSGWMEEAIAFLTAA